MPKIDPPVSFDSQTQRVYIPSEQAWRVGVSLGGEPIGPDNPLPVILNAEVTLDGADIKLGAIELQDQNTGVRADIELVYDFGALMVQDVIEHQKERITLFAEQSVSKGNTLTLITRTTGTGKRFVATGAVVGGEGSGIFRVKHEGNVKYKLRNSGSERTATIKFPEELHVSDGETVLIEAENNYRKTALFEVTLVGYEVND